MKVRTLALILELCLLRVTACFARFLELAELAILSLIKGKLQNVRL